MKTLNVKNIPNINYTPRADFDDPKDNMLCAGERKYMLFDTYEEMDKLNEMAAEYFDVPLDQTLEIQLNEGFDIDNKSKTVSFNPKHEKNVYTRSLTNSRPVRNKKNGIPYPF